MKTHVSLLALLAIFYTQTLGYEVVNYISSTSNGSLAQETVQIENEKNVAIINIHEGKCSSTTIFDYKHGYIASRLLSRRACYIMKMDHVDIPALDELKRYIYERQEMQNMFSPKYTWVKYNPIRSLLTNIDWLLFGSPIENLCKHVSLYKAEVAKTKTGAKGCAKVGLLGILHIGICADLSL
ncbi:gastrokine-2 [Phascolarctos cinereus]|uniref:Gastrokine-2 n=1 Tax=Phascolarctos cinereus TaxID=38626 RepID=A0A6P5K7K2_PHACI|nr:gastrokine-2 [Phascolarctos cinereus]